MSPVTDHGCHGPDGVPDHRSTALFYLALLQEDPSNRRFEGIGLFSYLYFVAQALDLIKFRPDEIGEHMVVPRVHGCLATRGASFTLASDGTIGVCNELVGSSLEPVGIFWPTYHVNTDVLDPWLIRDSMALENCQTCAYRFFCGGGCALTSLRQGTPLGDCGSVVQDFQTFFAVMAPAILQRWAGLQC